MFGRRNATRDLPLGIRICEAKLLGERVVGEARAQTRDLQLAVSVESRHRCFTVDKATFHEASRVQQVSLHVPQQVRTRGQTVP